MCFSRGVGDKDGVRAAGRILGVACAHFPTSGGLFRNSHSRLVQHSNQFLSALPRGSDLCGSNRIHPGRWFRSALP